MTVRYRVGDIGFDLPEGFEDRSVNIFEWPSEGGRIGLVVQRESARRELDLSAYVAEQTRDYATRFDAFRLEAQDADELPLAQVRSKRFRFKREQEVFFTHQAFVHNEGTVFVFTGSGKASQREIVDDLVGNLIQSLHLREAP